jgi:hypothetical protein
VSKKTVGHTHAKPKGEHTKPGANAKVQMALLNDFAVNGRIILTPTPIFSALDTLPLSELEQLERLVAASPHNRQICTQTPALINAAIELLPRLDEPPRRAAVIRVVRHLGNHRFTVHNTRRLLAAIQQSEADASSAASLELLQLLGDVLSGAGSPSAEPSAFWDMAAGVMGATGFDLPAEKIVSTVAKGGFTLSAWVRLEQLSASPTAVFGVSDAAGSGLQLQLQRSTAGLARPALLLSEPPRASGAARLLGGMRALGANLESRFGATQARHGQPGAAGAAAVESGATLVEFDAELPLRCGTWHFITLSCRKGSLLSLVSAAGSRGVRDEALVSLDGSRAARAAGFSYPALGCESGGAAKAGGATAAGHAAVGAPATPRTPAASLRGLLGPFVLLDAPLGAAEVEAAYEAGKSSRALFEQPRVIAAWHPLLSESSSGVCVAATAEGPWAARPRSEAISVVEPIRARDNAGGLMAMLLPLLPLRRRVRARSAEGEPAASGSAGGLESRPGSGGDSTGDATVAATIRLLSLLLTGRGGSAHTANVAEMLRSQAMSSLGHLLRTLHPSNLGEQSLGALASLAEAARPSPALYRELLDQVMLRFDAWRRLHPSVVAPLLHLVNDLATSDEVAARSVALPQRLMDAARRALARTVASTPPPPPGSVGEAHAQYLSPTALLASGRLACLHATPLLAHALQYGAAARGAEAEAQEAALGLLLRLVEAHGTMALDPLQPAGGMLALLELMGQRPAPTVALLAARLVTAPLAPSGSPPGGLSAQWREWMHSAGLAHLSTALAALPGSDSLFDTLLAIMLHARPEEVDALPHPRLATVQLLPAFLGACARAPPEVQARQLERISLYLRLCPQNCDAFTATARLWQPHAAAMLAAAISTSGGAAGGAAGAEGAQLSLAGTLVIELLCTYAETISPRSYLRESRLASSLGEVDLASRRGGLSLSARWT